MRGDLTGEESGPLPRIPPFLGHLNAIWKGDRTQFTLTGRGAARQNRLGEFEEPTAGYFTMDASLEKELFHGRWFHTVVLRGTNLLNTEYRNHLSRIKSIMPEAGLGVSLVYRVHYLGAFACLG